MDWKILSAADAVRHRFELAHIVRDKMAGINARMRRK